MTVEGISAITTMSNLRIIAMCSRDMANLAFLQTRVTEPRVDVC